MDGRAQQDLPRTRSAFTLIELIFLLAIMGVLAAMAAPRYSSSLANYRTEAAAQRIRADLALAASAARITGSSRTVLFYPSGDRYLLSDMADNDHPDETYTVVLTEDPYAATLISATFEDGAVVTFNGFGLPDKGGKVVVQSGDIQKTVFLEAGTGEVTIE